MRRPSPEHYMLIVAFVGTIMTELAGSGDSWVHMKQPSFWAVVFMQMGIVIRSIYTPKPQRPEES